MSINVFLTQRPRESVVIHEVGFSHRQAGQIAFIPGKDDDGGEERESDGSDH